MLKQKRMSIEKINELFKKKYPNGNIYHHEYRKGVLSVSYSDNTKVYDYISGVQNLAEKLGLIESVNLARFYVHLEPSKFFKSKFNPEKVQIEKDKMIKEAKEILKDTEALQYVIDNIGNLEALNIHYYKEIV